MMVTRICTSINAVVGPAKRNRLRPMGAVNSGWDTRMFQGKADVHSEAANPRVKRGEARSAAGNERLKSDRRASGYPCQWHPRRSRQWLAPGGNARSARMRAV